METFKKFLVDLQLHGRSEVTQRNYLCIAKKFAEYCDHPIEETEIDHVREFLHYLRYQKKLTVGSVNYYHTAIKFLFQVTLDKAWNDWKVPRLRGYKSLPAVLSQEEVSKLLNCVVNLKHKAILTTIYSGGLRVSEACRLKVGDIDSNNMQIFIRQSKGNKDRYTVLSQKTLVLLRSYWRECGQPKDWLFPGQKAGDHITSASVRAFLKDACKAEEITKAVTVHTLRHCFATHLLEANIDIFRIKVLLGHSSITSTCLYLHLVRPDAFGVNSPLDIWGGDADA